MTIQDFIEQYKQQFLQSLAGGAEASASNADNHIFKKLEAHAQATAENLLNVVRKFPQQINLEAFLISQVDSLKSIAREQSARGEKLSQISQAYETLKMERDDLKAVASDLEVILSYVNEIFDLWSISKNRPLDAPFEDLKKLRRNLAQLSIEVNILLHNDPESMQVPANITSQLKILLAEAEFLIHVCRQEMTQVLEFSKIYRLMHQLLFSAFNNQLGQSSRTTATSQSVNWKNTFFMKNKSLAVLRRAKYSTIKHTSHPIIEAQRFEIRDFRTHVAAFSGSTYVGSEEPLTQCSNTSSDAIAITDNCFAITDGCGYYTGPEYEDVKRIAGAIAKNLVRLSQGFTKPNAFKKALWDIFKGQQMVAKGKIANPLNMKYATGGLVKIFAQANGKFRVITGSISDGIILAFDPKTETVYVLAEGRQYGTQPKPINLDENDELTNYLQITDFEIPQGSIILGFTDGVSALFDPQIMPPNHFVSYTRILPNHDKVVALFNELFKQNRYPTGAQISEFLLNKLLEKSEESRFSIEETQTKKVQQWIRTFAGTLLGDVMLLEDADFSNAISSLTIQNFLDWLQNTEIDDYKLTLTFIESTEFAAQCYDQPKSLSDAFNATFKAHAGDDASMVIYCCGGMLELTLYHDFLEYLNQPMLTVNKKFSEIALDSFLEYLVSKAGQVPIEINQQTIGHLKAIYGINKEIIRKIDTFFIDFISNQVTYSREVLERTLKHKAYQRLSHLEQILQAIEYWTYSVAKANDIPITNHFSEKNTTTLKNILLAIQLLQKEFPSDSFILCLSQIADRYQTLADNLSKTITVEEYSPANEIAILKDNLILNEIIKLVMQLKEKLPADEQLFFNTMLPSFQRNMDQVVAYSNKKVNADLLNQNSFGKTILNFFSNKSARLEQLTEQERLNFYSTLNALSNNSLMICLELLAKLHDQITYRQSNALVTQGKPTELTFL